MGVLHLIIVESQGFLGGFHGVSLFGLLGCAGVGCGCFLLSWNLGRRCRVLDVLRGDQFAGGSWFVHRGGSVVFRRWCSNSVFRSKRAWAVVEKFRQGLPLFGVGFG
jgi:hypothetical protein